MPHPFQSGQWIWNPHAYPNQYTLFVKTIDFSTVPDTVRITASHHYELYIDGTFVARGPVHGDPKWCQYDEISLRHIGTQSQVQVAILVHHRGGTHVSSLVSSPAGLLAEFICAGQCIGTDASWKCLGLPMWRQDVPARGWALGYCEDYDARLEPQGWGEKRFDAATWENAVIVADQDMNWQNYQRRITPFLQRSLVEPLSYQAFIAEGEGAEEIGAVSEYCDTESLVAVGAQTEYTPDSLHASCQSANAFTFDLGTEHIGFAVLELEAPPGVIIDISGAELMNAGRPWIFRKGTRYSARYRTKAGRQRFTTYDWNGFRYLHIVVRGDASQLRLHRVGCVSRRPALTEQQLFAIPDPALQRIYTLCRYTLEISAQEHLIDCPTREQAQYWGDAVFVAQSLWKGFAEPSYLTWYLECFLHVPFREDGQIPCVYPGEMGQVLLDYSLIPILGQRFYYENTGSYYQPEATLAKALALNQWYTARLDQDGLLAFDYQAYAKEGLRNFIDHPGIGWHDFPHRGIDRDGISCPLNIFYYQFILTLAEIAESLGDKIAQQLYAQASQLKTVIRQRFFDGCVFHDADEHGHLSSGTSWQTNALAVYFGIVSATEATPIIQAMLDGYDTLCRCSPYFHFYFLPALRIAGLTSEAHELIKKEWKLMLDGDATATWEGFAGDAKDSLCHPWSTAPFLFLLEDALIAANCGVA